MRLADLATINSVRFRCMRRGAIVRIVRASCGMRARFWVAILSLALTYALTCSATCALCLESSAAAATPSHECGHAAPDAGSGSHRQGPVKPDCFGHHHSGFEAVQTDGPSRIQLSATGGASQMLASVVSSEVLNVGSSFLSDLARPQDSTIFPQRKISILRI